MQNDTIFLNRRPIHLLDVRVVDWGITFFVTSELDAYKAAYAYRYCEGTEVKCVTGRWYVTVFNEEGKKLGFC